MKYGFFNGPTRVTVYSIDTVEAVPRWLMPLTMPLKRYIPSLTEYDSLWDFCVRRRPRRICLYRTYALGDILMLLPIARALHRRLALPEPISIVVEHRFMALSRLACPEIRFIRKRGLDDYGADVHFNLDGALEMDHSGGEASDHHRLSLYGRAIGLEVLPCT